MKKSIKDKICSFRSSKAYNLILVYLCAITYTGISILFYIAFGENEKLMHATAYFLPLAALLFPLSYVYFSKKFNKRFCVFFQAFEVLPDIVCIILAVVVLHDFEKNGSYPEYLFLFFCTLALFYKTKIINDSETKKDQIEELNSQGKKIQNNISELQKEKDEIQNKIDNLQRQKNNVQLEMDVLRGRK